MNRLLLIAIPFVLFALSCKNKKPQDIEEKYNITFRVGKIPGIDSFYILNEHEHRVDSLLKQGSKPDFKTNRSRVFMDSDPHNKVFESGQGLDTGSPMPCECVIQADTIFVNMSIGFIGGSGFYINLFRDQFQSGFFMYTDDVKPYKSNLNDTAFSGQVIAKSKYQELVLDEKPGFRPGQQITGLLTYTSNTFYEKKLDNRLDSTYVTGKIYFTCKTQEYKEPWWGR